MLVLDHVDADTVGGVRTEVDGYVPVTLKFAYRETAPTVYWRANPSPRTLLEVGLCSQTGRLRSVVVTAIEALRVATASDRGNLAGESETSGVPCFDVTGWPTPDDFAARFKDEALDVRLVVGDRGCSVEFGEPSVPTLFARVSNVRCAFDDRKALVRIDIESLDAAQVEMLHRLVG